MYNTIDKIARRTCNELEGLKMEQLENSYRTESLYTSLIITKAIKKYSFILNLIKKYIIKLKH